MPESCLDARRRHETAGEARPGEGDALLLVDGGTRWLHLSRPVAVVTAESPGEVVPVIREVESAAGRGLHAAGWLTYEAGEAFGLPVVRHAGGPPLAAFALFRAGDARDVTAPEGGGRSCCVSAPRRSWNWETYLAAFERIREHLASGDAYQVNATFDLHARLTGEARGLFVDLVRAQRGGHAACLTLGHWTVCSASPELFFDRRGTRIVTRPMKGTAPRGRTAAEDRAAAAGLAESAKERAENVMIVDMMRNDLGRIARTGSVRVPRLFSIERYPTVWQMTSEVTAESAVPLDAVFAALFPSASVTGAPKVRTMEIIRDIERRPRGVYTGAIGHVAPGGDAQFSVAIRTAVVDRRRGTLTFGVGSGVVWDSDARAEYRECLLKGDVLGRTHVPFELLETLRWAPDEGYTLLDEHLRRLHGSAACFGYACDAARVREVLDAAVAAATRPLRVRLLVNEAGEARTESYPLESGKSSRPLFRACVAREPIHPGDVFLFHKTTRRDMYETRRCRVCDDVVLWNTRGELTEFTTGNLVVEIDGLLLTPPVGSGLLAGTLRGRLLEEGRVRERVLTRGDLSRASRLWLLNSVHGWQTVNLQEH